ncbi:MAG TPA: PAS domain S-box protein [Geobacteraceae bacterium]|nr:PAS domain S-box protein [Geobacteraceae bacterium]
MPLKKSTRQIFLYGVIAVSAISLTTIFSLVEIRREAVRQAMQLQESHIKTFWELLRAKGKTIGIVKGKLVVGDYVINGNFDLPDTVKEIFGGRATVFMGDVRVSTNVLLPDGTRAVGTRLDGPARDALFRQGKSYRGESTILGVPYFVAYDPIRDSGGRVVGALFVGVEQSDFLAAYNKFKIGVAAIHIVLAGTFIILSLLLMRRRRTAEESIRASEERLKLALEGSNYVTWDMDLVAREVRHNRRWADILGYDDNTVIMNLDDWKDLIHPDDLPDVMGSFHDHLEGRADRHTVEYRVRCKSGEWKWFLDRGKVVSRDASGTPLRMAGTSADINDRKIAEEALRTSEANYRAIFDAANDAIIVHDIETGEILDVNRRMCELYGYTRDESLCMKRGLTGSGEVTWSEEVSGERMVKAVGGETRLFEERARSKDGREFWVEVSLKRAVIGGKERLLEVVRDISARKRAEAERDRLEDQLRQSHKMEAVGQLAGGIAHDFNNILTAIIGYAHLILLKMTGDNQPRNYVEQILASAERAAGLTQGLLAFSRKQVINPQPVELNGIVRNVRKFLERIIGEDIEQQIFLEDRDLVVMADTGQMEQVLMNLATNARDAMPEGGVLRIVTSVLEIERNHPAAPGSAEPLRYACLSVTDTGSGIEGKDRERLFEPFFTTKEVGKGTGLGLSIAYGIVKEHNGYIAVESEEGKGTTFRIYLPLISPDRRNSDNHEPFLPPRGTETVLVAEDDDEVRQLHKSLLEECGYSVIEAADGQAAVDVFSAHEDSIHLIILDVVMPKKNAREAFEEIRRIRPGVRTIFMSGYSADFINRKGFVDEGFAFVEKPIIPLSFLRKVREVLDRRE